MTHSMKLHREPFTLMAAGKKTVELRLNDEKRRLLSVDDVIVFTNPDGESLCMRVRALRPFPSFRELYQAFSPEEMGYLPGEEACPEDMDAYYTPEEQKRWGALAICLESADACG